MELAVYCFLAILAGLALYTLYTVGMRARQATISSYLVSVDTETAIRWIRRDLQETALVSIRTYPNADAPGEPPGCSFLSGRDLSEKDEGKLNVSTYGAPQWTKYVFYTLVKGGRTGQLVRWEKALDAAQRDYVPRQTDVKPSAIPAGTKSMRVMIKDALEPSVTVDMLADSPGWKTNEFGGFRLQFVRRTGGEGGAEVLSSINPSDHDKVPDTADNTSLLEVELKVLTSDTSRPSVYDIKFRVHPRY